MSHIRVWAEPTRLGLDISSPCFLESLASGASISSTHLHTRLILSTLSCMTSACACMSSRPSLRTPGLAVVGRVGRPNHGRGGDRSTSWGPWHIHQTCTEPFFYIYDRYLDPDVAGVDKEDESREPKCVEKGALKPTGG